MSEILFREFEKIPKWKLMMYLQENGETSAYALSKELGWTTGKVHAIIKNLEKSGAVESKIKIFNNRPSKYVKLIE